MVNQCGFCTPGFILSSTALLKEIKKITENLLRQATREALKEAKPLEENEYKKELVEVVVSRAAFSLVSH